MNGQKRRVTVKLKCPNPLFEEWLTSWRDEAAAKDSKMQHCFNLALKSLKKYPLPLDSGRECKILKGFGNRICEMLDEKLMDHQRVDGQQALISQNNSVEPNTLPHKNQSTRRNNSTWKDSPSSKEYIPQYGSGGYAILVTLYKQSLQPNYPGFLSKSEIVHHGKNLVNTSFTKPDPASRYTAWSSMGTLIQKNLVSKVSHPPKFSLTCEGEILAKKLHDQYEENKSGKGHKDYIQKENLGTIPGTSGVNHKVYDLTANEFEDQRISNLETNSSSSGERQKKVPLERTVSSPLVSYAKGNKTTISKYASTNSVQVVNSVNSGQSSFKKYSSSSSVASSKSTATVLEGFIMVPHTFDIILCVDTNETSGSSNTENDEILVRLKNSGIKFEVKNLKVGDFTWICRDRTTQKELILPYIIERKRMDDFASSIRDRRYYEQKFRLKRSGIENLTYLVENYGRNQHLGLPLQTLYQAASNTAIQENFFVKFTENTKETAEYLIYFSRNLIHIFKSKTLASCSKSDIQPTNINSDIISLMTFKEFNESSSKNKKMKVSDLFVKMLIQIKGMSVERALAIIQKYPTPHHLNSAYEENSGDISEKLLSSIKFGTTRKTIGPVLSKIVYQTFTNKQY